MRGVVVIDACLLLLLIVGSADPKLIGSHKRLKDDYSAIDYDLLILELATFTDVVTVSFVLAEAYNLAKQIQGPAFTQVNRAFRVLVEGSLEIPISASVCVRQAEFNFLGLADTALLRACRDRSAVMSPTLLTADKPLAQTARGLGIVTLLYAKDEGFDR